MVIVLAIAISSLALLTMAYRVWRGTPVRHVTSSVPGHHPSTSTSADSAQLWERHAVSYTTDSLGINLPWLDLHNGDDFKLSYNWLSSSYDPALVEADLAE